MTSESENAVMPSQGTTVDEKLVIKKELSKLKRLLTNQIKIIDEDLKARRLSSSSALRRKIENLEETLTNLNTKAEFFEALELDIVEETWIENYVLQERNRVIDTCGAVNDHLNSREDEESSINGADQRSLRSVGSKEKTKESNLQEGSNPENVQKWLDSQSHETAKHIEKKKHTFVSWMSRPDEPTSGDASNPTIKSKMPVFGGDPLDFIDWSNMFHALVHSTNRSSAEKMGLLKANLKPECQEVIKGFTNSDDHYKEALQTLYERYGAPHLLERAHIQAIRNLPGVKEKDSLSFTLFADRLQGHLRVVASLFPEGDGLLTSLMFELEHKLDQTNFHHWRSFSTDLPREKKIYSFAKWAAYQAAEYRYFDLGRSTHPREPGPKNVNNVEFKEYECRLCNGSHVTKMCKNFQEADPSKRIELIQKCGLCFLCLGSGHRARKCPKKKEISCRKDGCGGNHHTLLHKPSPLPRSNTNRESKSPTDLHINTCGDGTKLGIIPIICSNGNKSVKINALVDEGSDSTLITERVVKLLKIPKPKMRNITMNLLSKELECKTGIVNLDVAGIGLKSHRVQALTLSNVCKNLSAFQWSSIQKKFKHLSDLSLPNLDGPVEMLIGVDHIELITPWEVRRGGKGEPVAMRCDLGWVVRGQTFGLQPIVCANVNFTQLSQNLEDMMKTLFDSETFGAESQMDHGPAWSQENKYAMKLIQEGTKKLSNNPGYETSLPWKIGLRPENDQEMAKKRFSALQRKMRRNPTFCGDYRKAIQDYINHGYAIKIDSKREIDHPNQRWLPHHGVYKTPESKKLRVVFDSAAPYHGLSLNDCLYTGPALQNDLQELLLQFREFEVAMTADIEAMYSRIKMKKEDARYHRFLWETEPGGPTELYEMQGVVFGDAPSPCQAIHVLHRTAEDFGSPEVLKIVKSNFYMDDYLDSYPTSKEAIKWGTKVKNTLKEGNFHLTKWLSNDTRVVESCGQVLNLTQEKNLDLGLEKGKILGMIWKMSNDCLSFALKRLDNPPVTFSRRNLLSQLAGIFDPLGLACPFTVKGKIGIQHQVKKGMDWDSPVSEDDRAWWENWLKMICNMKLVQIPRCLRPNWAQDAQMHVFCDASMEAFATVVYLRLSDESGRVETRIVMARTRVAPIKPISVAKLELNAAVLGSRVAQRVGQALKGTFSKRVFWTDSSAVRGWLRGTASFYKPFVSNRIGEIQTLTNTSEWRFVPGKINPADQATRSTINAKNPITQEWIEGPVFLHQPEITWPQDIQVPPNYDDIKQKFQVFQTGANVNKLQADLTWYKNLNTFGEAITKMTQDDQELATDQLIKQAQRESFGEELEIIGTQKKLKKNSRLFGLDPTIDPKDKNP